MSIYRALSDQELTRKLAGADENAFIEIYRRYQPGIRRFIARFVHSPLFAEDLSQEVFVKIWESSGRLAEVRSIKAYLITTARNHTINSMKKAFRSKDAMGIILAEFSEDRNTTEEDIMSKEYMEFLERTLANLPLRSREIFRLCREQGKTYDEAAIILGISRNAIKNHMVSTMKTLSKAVQVELGISLSVFLTVITK